MIIRYVTVDIVQFDPLVINLKVLGPVTLPEMVKVDVPPTSYQFGNPYKVLVTVPPP